jgi:hypothetical protein
MDGPRRHARCADLQRATSDADQRIADKLSELVAEHEGTKKINEGDDDDGWQASRGRWGSCSRGT